MKKTLLVTLDFYPSLGGVSRYWERLGEYMPSDRWAVLAPHCSPSFQAEGGIPPVQAFDYPVIRRRMITRWLYPQWLWLLVSLFVVCRRYHIERVIAAQVLPVGTTVMVVCWILRIPYSVSVHGMDVLLPKKQRRKHALCKKIFSRAQHVIANCATTRKSVERYGILASHIEIVYPAPVITPAVITESLTLARDDDHVKILLTVGRLVKRKGHEYILRALHGVRAEMPDVTVVIIGDGPHRAALEALSHELGLAESVRFLGIRSDQETAQWYNACTLFIMTPEDIEGDVEGFGIVYLEAQSFGKPVIGSRTGGVVEAVHDGVTGLLVEPKDTVGIQRAVLRLLSDPTYAQTLGENGRRRVEEEFQWKRSAEKLQYLLSL